MKQETVEEFLARGGRITQVDPSGNEFKPSERYAKALKKDREALSGKVFGSQFKRGSDEDYTDKRMREAESETNCRRPYYGS